MRDREYGRNAENNRLAEEVCRYLMENMEQHITAEQLAARFHVSATRLKTSFQRRYGMPLYTYVRGEKMRSAARMLGETNKSVLTVAMEHGYSNGSKFAKAFRDVMGMTPRQYRNTEKSSHRREVAAFFVCLRIVPTRLYRNRKSTVLILS